MYVLRVGECVQLVNDMISDIENFEFILVFKKYVTSDILLNSDFLTYLFFCLSFFILYEHGLQ